MVNPDDIKLIKATGLTPEQLTESRQPKGEPLDEEDDLENDDAGTES